MSYKDTLKSAVSILGKTTFFASIEGAAAGISGSLIQYRENLILSRIAMAAGLGALGNSIICLAIVSIVAPCYPAIKDCLKDNNAPEIPLKKPSEIIKFLPIMTCVSGMAIGWAILKPNNIAKEDSPIIGIYGICFNIVAALLYAIGKFCYGKFRPQNVERMPLLSITTEDAINNNSLTR